LAAETTEGTTMPTVSAADGTQLYYEETGSGIPLVFVHEYAGDLRSWEQQVRYFSRRYRCITFNARGYPPSQVPTDQASYSQDHAADDIASVIKGLGLGPTHVIGCSMGAFAALHVGLRYPELCRSIVASGVGFGAEKGQQALFHSELDATIERIRNEGMGVMSKVYSRGPSRLIFEETDPRGYAELVEWLGEHDTLGMALTMGGVQRKRPSLYDLEAGFRAFTTPTLVFCGDEDDATLEPSLFLKRTIPTAGLAVLPKCGHTQNLEEPALFNSFVLDFITRVDAGRWPRRIPASQAKALIGEAKI